MEPALKDRLDAYVGCSAERGGSDCLNTFWAALSGSAADWSVVRQSSPAGAGGRCM